MAAPAHQWKATPVPEIIQAQAKLRATFATGRSKDLAYRREQLLQLAYLVQDNRERIAAALTADLHRHPTETELIELFPTIDSAIRAADNVKGWASPERVPLTMSSFPLRPTIYREAKGTVLIVGPFNYPIFCNIMPLIGAIAAGCAVVLKPSEGSPVSAALLTELIPKYLDPEMVTVVNGAIPEMQALLGLKWDHIFFTGSTTVGRIVARAAAEHLTPFTLELGGKNPAFIDRNVDVDAAARVLLWGKTVNGGQTCTAPDYLLVHRDVQDRFFAALKKAYAQFYPDADAQRAGQQAHLFNPAAFKRVVGLLERTNGAIITGAGLEGIDAATNYVPLTLVSTDFEDPLLESEIFGPVWPIVVVDDMEAAVKYTQTRESPLAVYVCSTDSKTVTYIRENTRSGAIIHNDAVVQGGVYGLPFGGIGASGQGAQGGKFTFDLFTYPRAAMSSPSYFEKLFAMRYPPYTDSKLSTIRSYVTPKIGAPRPGTESKGWRGLFSVFSVVLGIVASYAYKRKTD